MAEQEKIQRYRYVFMVLYLLYLVGVAHFTWIGREQGNELHYELELFWSYRHIWEDGSFFFWLEIVNNVLLFVPMGIVMPVAFRRVDSLWKIVLSGLLTSCVIELVQLFLRIGLFEFDDMMNNTLGAVAGFCLYKAGWNVWRRGNGYVGRMCGWLVLPVLVICYYGMLYGKYVGI